jgi:aryl-alcohol dehydrogenase-like predicted oxidoreductase
MTVRIPQSLSPGLQPETGWSVLDYELREQKAHTLGILGGQVEQALAALRVFDAEAHEADSEQRRHALLDGAADLVWAFMIQRELCGLRNWEVVVKDYGIPREVLNRVGQVRRRAD